MLNSSNERNLWVSARFQLNRPIHCCVIADRIYFSWLFLICVWFILSRGGFDTVCTFLMRINTDNGHYAWSKNQMKKKIGRKPAIEWSNINHIMKFTYIQCKQLILCTVFVLPYALKCVSIFFYKQTSWLNLVFKWNAEFHCRDCYVNLCCCSIVSSCLNLNFFVRFDFHLSQIVFIMPFEERLSKMICTVCMSLCVCFHNNFFPSLKCCWFDVRLQRRMRHCTKKG